MLVLRKGAYVSRHVYSLLSTFAPHISSDFVQKCVDGETFDKHQLIKKAPLVKLFGNYAL